MADEPTQAETAETSAETAVEDPEPEESAKPNQGDLPEGARKALDAARKAERNAEKRAKTAETRVKEFEDAHKTETEKAAEERDALKAEVEPLKGENLRLRVAYTKGLPFDLVGRLQGDTEEEVGEDADRLLALVTPQPGSGSFDEGARQSAPSNESPEEGHNKLLLGLLGRN